MHFKHTHRDRKNTEHFRYDVSFVYIYKSSTAEKLWLPQSDGIKNCTCVSKALNFKRLKHYEKETKTEKMKKKGEEKKFQSIPHTCRTPENHAAVLQFWKQNGKEGGWQNIVRNICAYKSCLIPVNKCKWIRTSFVILTNSFDVEYETKIISSQ